MRLITRFELARMPTQELYILHRTTFDALICSGFGTAARRNALASLENIECELASRVPEP